MHCPLETIPGTRRIDPTQIREPRMDDAMISTEQPETRIPHPEALIELDASELSSIGAGSEVKDSHDRYAN
jgi:hypothetical protein